MLIFVEVKTRKSTLFGAPEEAVNLRKLAHLRSAVEYYLQQHPDITADPRLDVIAIQCYQDEHPPVITHFENVLS